MIPTSVSILAVVSLLLMIVAGGIINLVLLYRRKQLSYIKDKEQLNISFENKLLQTKLEIQEQTFKTISEEIHDNIGQMLTLVKLNLNVLENSSFDDAKNKLQDTKEILGEAIQSLRDISKTLNSDAINKVGLVKAIEREMQVIGKAANLRTSFAHKYIRNGINENIELILFRIFQEAIHNVIKHARASSVIINLESNDEDLMLTIKDDGTGFDTGKENFSGTGITNIQSRCKLINATFHLVSIPGTGTEVAIHLPSSSSNYVKKLIG
jgi:signal transduction histidine kinase